MKQQKVTEFYNELKFPSTINRKNYEVLVPKDLFGKRVGDFGCGQSLFIEIFKKLNYDSVFLDISKNVIDKIDYGEKICASLTDIPLEDDGMDYIFCIGVVHHIPEMNKAINEIIRVLAPGGTLVLGVYAPKTITAYLKKIYDTAYFKILKILIEKITLLLMFFKNLKSNTSWSDNQKRVDDLLITPFVKYFGTDYYDQIITDAKAKVKKIDKFNQMNIIWVVK
jgi:ubiquinone/menaquinone biosynthesis C-methylase UbiE